MVLRLKHNRIQNYTLINNQFSRSTMEKSSNKLKMAPITLIGKRDWVNFRSTGAFDNRCHTEQYCKDNLSIISAIIQQEQSTCKNIHTIFRTLVDGLKF
jgi:hypothetical protein